MGFFAIKGKNISKIHRHLRQLRGIVRSAVLCQEAAVSSTRDSITRLYSDRGYREFLEQQFTIALKNANYPLSICLLTIDGFLAFCESHCRNDRDILLVELASLLSDVLRDSDIIARSNGGTFYVIFPLTVKDKALQLMEEVRLTVQGHLFHCGKGITISAGVSWYPDDLVEDVNSLHANAERALSEAIMYRNTVVAHSLQTVDTSAIKI